MRSVVSNQGGRIEPFPLIRRLRVERVLQVPAVVKAIACEAVAQTGLPLSRRSLHELTTRAHYALGKPISRSTVWRGLDTAAIKPWRYEHWIFPRHPRFVENAGVVVDLHAGCWDSRFVTPIISEHYVRKSWTRFEFDTALREERNRSSESILPIRTDGARLPGLHDGRFYLSLKENSIEDIAACIIEKCQEADRTFIGVHLHWLM